MLRSQFLTFGKRTDGSYSQHELMQSRAFIAFSHAEFETYLEVSSAKAVERAEKHWKRTSRPSKAIAAMLVYRISKDIGLPSNPRDQGSGNRLDTLIGKAISLQKAAIKRNHGIKPENLSELFIPIGLHPDQIDETLLIQLRNFGERRGDQVHTNSQISLPKIRDPFDDELSDISFLIDEIEKFDLEIAKLK